MSNLPAKQKTDWVSREIVSPDDTNGWGSAINALSDAAPNYSANGSFYNATYSNNVYSLTPIDENEAPKSYIEGMQATFKCPANNLADCSVNINSLGAKLIKTNYGTSLSANTLLDNTYVNLRYDKVTDTFQVTNLQLTGAGSPQVPVYINTLGKATPIDSYYGKVLQDILGRQIDKTYATLDDLSDTNDKIQYRNIGEIITSTLPLKDAGLHLLDGSLIYGGGVYDDFVNYIKQLYEENKKNDDSGYQLYAWTYTETVTPDTGDDTGTDTIEHIIYTKEETSPTALYNENGSVYSGADFTLTDGVIKYGENDVVYTPVHNIFIFGDGYFTTESEWQKSVVAHGVCGKFVYDTEENTVRLPKITGFIEGAKSIDTLGKYMPVDVLLPKITGRFEGVNNGWTPSGAFRSGGEAKGGSGNGKDVNITFDSSRSSKVYSGTDNTLKVHPPTVQVLYYIVIAQQSTQKNLVQANVDNIVSELNNKINKTDTTYITETYVNGTSGYRVYSDGYCEQWGRFYNNASANNVITLLVPFIDTNYQVLINHGVTGIFNAGGRLKNADEPNTFTTTTFNAVTDGSAGLNTVQWRACGYIN